MAEKQPSQRFSQALSTLSLPLIPVLIPALAHFMLATLALTTLTVFAGSVVYSHVALLLVTVWAALDRNRWESIAAFMFVLTVSGLADIILLGVSFNQLTGTGPGTFGAVMIIINLLCKPISLISSLLALYSRKDSFKFSVTKNQSVQSNEYTSGDYLEARPYAQLYIAQPYTQPIPSQQQGQCGQVVPIPCNTGSDHYEPQSN